MWRRGVGRPLLTAGTVAIVALAGALSTVAACALVRAGDPVPGAGPEAAVSFAPGSGAPGPAHPGLCAPRSGSLRACDGGSAGLPSAGPLGTGRSVVPGLVHPVVAPGGELNWYNETANLSEAGGQPTVLLGGLAYDPLVGDMVLFGGNGPCGGTCPTNATWEYDGYGWQNLTSTLAREADGLPPALVGTGFAWDPLWGGVLMTGGATASGTVSNQTWLFDASGWTNLTGLVNNRSNGSLASPDAAYGSMAYDGALGAMIVVNGCSSAVHGCSTALRGATFALGGPGTTWTDLGSSFTLGAGFPGSAGTGGWGAQMAYDASGAELVYFGGEDATDVLENYTWTMNGTGWYNVTASGTGCWTVLLVRHCYYPAATAFGGITWDGEFDEVLMAGGVNATYVPSSATSNFTGGKWYPECLFVCFLSAPAAESAGEMASNSSAVAPLLLAGKCTGPCTGDAYVYEESPQPTVVTVAPDPSETGVPVQVTATKAVGTGSGPFLYDTLFDNGRLATVTVSTEVDFATPVQFGGTFTYATAGNYTLQAEEVDYFFVSGGSPPVPLTVNSSLAASAISSSPTAPTTTTVVAFHLTVAHGVPGYGYAWTFGDGGTSSSAAPTHTFSSPGTYTVSVVVTDAVGAKVTRYLAVLVTKASTASPLAGLASGPGLYAILAAIAIVLALLVVLLLRSRAGPPAAPPPPGTGEPGPSAPEPPTGAGPGAPPATSPDRPG